MNKILLLIVALLMIIGCNSNRKNNNKSNIKHIVEKQNQEVISKKKVVGVDKPLNEKQDSEMFDTIIKETTDFDAALGLELTKFNFDGNHNLADYTNAIAKLNDDKFVDFVYRYLLADKKRFQKTDLSQFRELIMQKLKNINTFKSSLTSDTFIILVFSFTPKYCGETEYTGLNQTIKEVLLNLNSVNIGDKRKKLQMSLFKNAVNATGVMQKHSFLKGEKINDGIAKIIDEHLSKEQFSDAERDNLNQYKYCALVLSNPEKIQNELPDILNSWRGKKDWRYKACTVTLEAFDKGLRGKEASQYVKDKLFPNPGD